MTEQALQLFPAPETLVGFAEAWGIPAAIFVASVAILYLFKRKLVAKLRALSEATETKWDDAWVSVLDATGWMFYVAAGIFIASRFAELPSSLEPWLEGAVFVAMGVQAGLWIQRAVNSTMEVWVSSYSDAPSSGTAAAAVRLLSRIAIWSILLLVVLSNLGVELTTVVAGLGVGGVAAALAVQAVFSDVIAGLSMYFDRPFDIGDFVIVGEVMGKVTKIGLRTTRIDSLGGEKIVYPNGKLASNFIRNYRRMEERRIVFSFGLEYGLSADQLERAQQLAREVIEAEPRTRFDRVHFKEFGDYSLNFEAVYFVLSPDFNVYMDVQHAINLRLYRAFEEENLPFAFPTQTLFHRGLPAGEARREVA